MWWLSIASCLCPPSASHGTARLALPLLLLLILVLFCSFRFGRCLGCFLLGQLPPDVGISVSKSILQSSMSYTYHSPALFRQIKVGLWAEFQECNTFFFFTADTLTAAHDFRFVGSMPICMASSSKKLLTMARSWVKDMSCSASISGMYVPSQLRSGKLDFMMSMSGESDVFRGPRPLSMLVRQHIIDSERSAVPSF